MGVYKIKECPLCGEKYLGHIASKKCSVCREKEEELKAPVIKICPYCNLKFETTKGNKKFCTDLCKCLYHSREYYRRKYAEETNR